MNENIDENYNEYLEENKDFKEDCDHRFEPMDETSENEEILDNFEPRDEIFDVNKENMKKFKPREYKIKGNYFASNHHQLRSIESFTNKFKIISNIYQGKSKGMCTYCNSDIKFLHTIDFHHSDLTIKETKWEDRKNKDWKETMELFEKEKIIPLRGNCHSREQANVFNNYREVILRKNLFEKSAHQIEKLIHDKVKDLETQYNRNIKFRIVEWLKKRSIIEQ
ncbi:MAG: hypothetical protein ACFFDB_08540 [Promethearchaeota archaeon]